MRKSGKLAQILRCANVDLAILKGKELAAPGDIIQYGDADVVTTYYTNPAYASRIGVAQTQTPRVKAEPKGKFVPAVIQMLDKAFKVKVQVLGSKPFTRIVRLEEVTMATKDETRVRAVDAVTGVVLTTFKHAAIERMQGKGSWVHVNERGEFWQVPR